jgi:peptide/nickel transport system substrate-binding protein
MKVTRRELLKGAAVLGATGMVPAARPRDAQAQTTQKRELVTAQGGDISEFDPHFSTNSNEIRVSFNLFDNLTSRHPDGKLYPGSPPSGSCRTRRRGRSKLRQGVKFHNGDPFTSADASGASSARMIPPSRPWWPRR